VPVQAVQLVPQGLDGERVLADQEALELPLDDDCRLRIHRAVEALGPGVRPDLQVERAVLAGLSGDPGVLRVRAERVLGVDVERLDLRLTGDPFRLPVPGELPGLDVRDLQGLRPRLLGKGGGQPRGAERPESSESSDHLASSHVCLPAVPSPGPGTGRGPILPPFA